MLSGRKREILLWLSSLLGWTTNRKIIVIESDDWGSIRMASPNSYRFLLKEGYPVDECHYNKYDALESENDLMGLFEVLSSVKDKNGNCPIFTSNFTVANPDFVRIRNDGYKQYYYELFTDSYSRYPHHKNSFQIVKQGIEAGVVKPQSHGREHLNVNLWMTALQQNDFDTHMAFTQNMFTLHTIKKSWNKNEFMDAYKFRSLEEKVYLRDIASEAISIFENIWDFCPLSFMAPSYFWFAEIEAALNESGVKFIQGSPIQLVPDIRANKGFVKSYHYLGQKNKLGQSYLVRNVIFEPSSNPSLDWTTDCIRRISFAFQAKKPAIIQSHRVNYMGFIDPRNRSKNLTHLKSLLAQIVRRWPDVEFLSTPQLGEVMNNKD